MLWPRLGNPQVHKQFYKHVEAECANSLCLKLMKTVCEPEDGLA